MSRPSLIDWRPPVTSRTARLLRKAAENTVKIMAAGLLVLAATYLGGRA